MPWYAQRADLPDTHRMHADEGSQHEAVLLRIGYVEVPAPGTTAAPEDTGKQEDETPTAQPPVEPPAEPKTRTKAR